MTKDERQYQSIMIWRDSKGRGTLNLTMRFGKTRIAKLISERVNDKHPNCKIIIITPNDIVRKNAEDNMVVNSNTDIYTSNSYLEKCKSSKDVDDCTILIIDEIHKIINTQVYKYIKNINAKFKLGLTGAKLTDANKSLLNDLEMPVIDLITEDEALKNGWIAPYIEYNLGIQLDDEDKVKYTKYSQLITEVQELFKGSHNIINSAIGTKIFDTDFAVAMASFTGVKYTNPNTDKYVFIKPTLIRGVFAESMGWKKDLDITYEYNARINELYNPDVLYERAKLFNKYVRQRNEILVCNRNKLNTAIAIIDRFKDKPCICFNESIEMANMLYNHFDKSSIVYHSNIEPGYIINPKTGDYYRHKNGNPIYMGAVRIKKLAIEGIKDGTFKQLFTAKALNEGVTIENIELVITTGGDTNIDTHSQRRARGLTIDYANPNKVCIVVNIFIDDFTIDDKLIPSRDKQKLKRRQTNSSVIPIWIADVEQIKNDENSEITIA